jgi:hypothetical protein
MTASTPYAGRLSRLRRRVVWWYLNVDRVLGRRHVAQLIAFAGPVVGYEVLVGFGASMTPAVLIFTHSAVALLAWASGWF